LNREKTEVLWLGSKRNNPGNLPDLKFKSKPIKILGICFTNNEQKKQKKKQKKRELNLIWLSGILRKSLLLGNEETLHFTDGFKLLNPSRFQK